jgi:hypothetical protein
MTFVRRTVLVVLSLLALCSDAVSAQDSSRADWRAWFATKDSIANCIRGPLLSRVYGLAGEFTVHRTPTGGTCQAGPGPGDPTAWIIDSRLFCPDSNPATWISAPPAAPVLDERRIVSLEASRDSSLLGSLRCAIRPRAAVVVRTRSPRPPAPAPPDDALLLPALGR